MTPTGTWRWLATLLCAGLVLAGCGDDGGGGGGAAAGAGSEDRSSTTVAIVTEADNSQGNASPHPAQQQSSGPGPQSTPPTPPPGAPDQERLPLRAELGKACLHPGDTQTIEITSEPEAFVGYSSVYSDGKTGLDPGFYGGANQAQTDANGTWKDAWVVAANAPPGRVTVDVVGAKGGWAIGQIQLSYELRPALDPC